MALVATTPLSVLRQGSAWGMSDSSLSIDSLLLAAEDRNATPEQSRRNPFNKAIGTLGYFLFRMIFVPALCNFLCLLDCYFFVMVVDHPPERGKKISVVGVR